MDGQLKAETFRYEEREKSIDEICSKTGFPFDQMLQYRAMIHRGNFVSNQNGDYRKFYTTELIDIVTPFFQLDMDAFGYDFDGPIDTRKPVTYKIDGPVTEATTI